MVVFYSLDVMIEWRLVNLVIVILTWKMEERDSPTRLRGKRLFGIPDEALPHQARYI